MKIYLASSFDLKEKVEWWAEYLKLFWNAEITREWWKKDYKKIKKSDSEWYNLKEVKEVCKANFKAIDRADILILIAPDDKPKKFNGANIELGYALAKGKKTIIMGQVERCGMYAFSERIPSNTSKLYDILKPFENRAREKVLRKRVLK